MAAFLHRAMERDERDDHPTGGDGAACAGASAWCLVLTFVAGSALRASQPAQAGSEAIPDLAMAAALRLPDPDGQRPSDAAIHGDDGQRRRRPLRGPRQPRATPRSRCGCARSSTRRRAAPRRSRGRSRPNAVGKYVGRRPQPLARPGDDALRHVGRRRRPARRQGRLLLPRQRPVQPRPAGLRRVVVLPRLVVPAPRRTR